VLGGQYRDQNGILHWVFAVWAEQDTNARVYPVSDGELPARSECPRCEQHVAGIGVTSRSPRRCRTCPCRPWHPSISRIQNPNRPRHRQ
jgi:hypothetical protein